MGSGSYSYSSRNIRAESMGYFDKSPSQIFKQRTINNAMSPNGVLLRESRDSDEHPNTVSIIIGLDVTGSMGSIPHNLVQDGLPTLMSRIIQNGINDPQLMFLAIGDHECDDSPLQVGQFESSDELLDKWLTDTYLEGGGGGNAGESYLLAWYFAAHHTEIDSFQKRGKKGFLITIGDEPTLRNLPKHAVKSIMGDGQYSDYTASELLDKARETYHVFHINLTSGRGSSQNVINGWKELMGDNLLLANHYSEVPALISDAIISHTDFNDVQVMSEPVSETVCETINESSTSDNNHVDPEVIL